jgi:hypothetical protein
MTDRLRQDLAIDDADGFYETLINAHQGLDERQTRLLDARLILLLANEVGDRGKLDDAIAAARAGVLDAPDSAGGASGDGG